MNKIVPIGKVNLQSIAHISLCNLHLPEADDLVISKLRRALVYLYSFTLRLNGADVFMHGSKTRTLYLKIENPEPINMLYALIAREFRIPKRITPHITIARRIPVKYFDKINPGDFNLYDEFLCDRIIVLKKGKENTKFEILLNTDHPTQKQPSGSSSAPA